MRLTVEEQSIIKQTIESEFGENAVVMLFGSRVNDELKGGY